MPTRERTLTDKLRDKRDIDAAVIAGDMQKVREVQDRIKQKESEQMPVSPPKAREILDHGEVRGKPLSRAQRGFFGARSVGLPPRNAPLFPTPSDYGVGGIKPDDYDPLAQSDGMPGKPLGFSGKSGASFDGSDAFTVDAPHPNQPINDADFPNPEVFDKGTDKNFNTGGLF